jgi:GntR family transcriptional regulator
MFKNVNVDRSAPLDLRVQVAAALRRAIAAGEAVPGDRLPPAADLAAVLEVNRNTVLRALRDLRDEGLIEFRRGRGVTVTATPGKSEVLQASRELLDLATRHGYQRHELVDLIATLPA